MAGGHIELCEVNDDTWYKLCCNKFDDYWRNSSGDQGAQTLPLPIRFMNENS